MEIDPSIDIEEDEQIEKYIQKERIERQNEVIEQFRRIKILKEEQEELQNENKRQYLKQQIVECENSDEIVIQNFIQFYKQFVSKNKSIDVESKELDVSFLSFQELRKLVKTFKNVHQSVIYDPIEEPQQQSQIEVQKINLQYKAAKISYEEVGAWDYQLKGFEICKDFKRNYDIKKGDKISIDVRGQVVKNGGFLGLFGVHYDVCMNIKTSFFRKQVKRNLQDFTYFRNLLKNVFPHKFIPPLLIPQKPIQCMNNVLLKITVQNACANFLRALCRDQNLLQNNYTWLFFLENSENFQSFKEKHKNRKVTRLFQFENLEGTVEIEISKENELKKKDYHSKSNHIDHFWKKINQRLKRFQNMTSQSEKELSSICSLFNESINFTKQNEYYHNYTNVMQDFEKTFSVIFKTIKGLKDNLKQFYDKVSLPAEAQWAEFNFYRQQIEKISQDYKLKRKRFIQKQFKFTFNNQTKPTEQDKNQSTKNVKQKQDTKKGKKPQNVNSQIGIDEDQNEQAWIQRYSKWQGYINIAFTSSFQQLLRHYTSKMQIVYGKLNKQSGIHQLMYNHQNLKSVILEK